MILIPVADSLATKHGRVDADLSGAALHYPSLRRFTTILPLGLTVHLKGYASSSSSSSPNSGTKTKRSGRHIKADLLMLCIRFRQDDASTCQTEYRP